MEQQKKLGHVLIEKNAVTAKQLAEAMALQIRLHSGSQKRLRIGEILVALKVIRLDQLHDSLRSQGPKAQVQTSDQKCPWITRSHFKGDRKL